LRKKIPGWALFIAISGVDLLSGKALKTVQYDACHIRETGSLGGYAVGMAFFMPAMDYKNAANEKPDPFFLLCIVNGGWNSRKENTHLPDW
jgi:hypothetical protein